MNNVMNPMEYAERVSAIPGEIPILPLRNTVVYPFSMLPLVVGIPRSVKLIEDSLENDRLVGLIAMKDPSIETPGPDQTHETGTVAIICHVKKMTNDTLQVVVQGLERFRIKQWLEADPYLRARIELVPDMVETGIELDALERILCDLAKEVVSLSPDLPEEISTLLERVQDPRQLTYLVATNARLEVGEGQQILEIDNIKEKLRALISYLVHEKEVLTLGKKIQTEAQGEIDKAQKEYYLRQQIRAIQKELGEAEDDQSEISGYAEKIAHAGLPEEAGKEAQQELRRLRGMTPQAAEYSLIKTYLDCLVELPWKTLSEDNLDIAHARLVLDEDHYDLQEVKDRIIEYLAVRKLLKERGIHAEPGKEAAAGEAMGAILCFVGPPGVGKTSLGQSIARALGRQFTRMSLGGMRDEAEIRGHRRTYIGAMPGRIIQAIRRAGTRNPVFMLDEIDKIGSDWRGDPSSALLEVLDPSQNHTFRDHYLNVDFDLSDVIFITTANQLETIPDPLRDRMEIIQLDGYTEHEKIHIAEKYLIPRQLKTSGLNKDEVTFTGKALRKIVCDYTREAGVRNLERQIGSICRKCVMKIASGEMGHVQLTPEKVREYLKREKFESECSESIEIPGIATGLAVTAVGGDILFIEATRMKGKGKLTVTGQLGEVMCESAYIAHNYVRSKAGQLGIDPDIFEDADVHVHVPAGAIPKDGPSAGLAMVTAIGSLFSGQPVRSDVGMTGEITLRGRVLPVGGIKMKVMAAHRAGLKTVVLPKRNERDLEDLPVDVREAIAFVLVEWIDEVFDIVLEPGEKTTQPTGTIGEGRSFREFEARLN